MPTAGTVAIRIAPEAQARMDELGMQQALTALLDQARQTVEDLGSVEVTRNDDPEGEDEPRVVITARRNVAGSVDDSSHRRWVSWLIQTFSGDVRWNFGLSVRYRGPHDRDD